VIIDFMLSCGPIQRHSFSRNGSKHSFSLYENGGFQVDFIKTLSLNSATGVSAYRKFLTAGVRFDHLYFNAAVTG